MPEVEIEQWQPPAISPGTPLGPAPKYVPFNYGKMTPGNYYSHSLGYQGTKWDRNMVDAIYREGVRVNQGRGSTFRPSAWNQIVEPSDLGSYNQNKNTAQRLGHQGGARTGTGRNPRRATIESNLWSTKARTSGAKAPSFILKGGKDLFLKPGPDFIPNAKGPAGGWGAARDPSPDGRLNLQRPYSGHISPKKILGHFPAGSTQMMTKPGMMTGKMPMIRGFGGGLIDMFMKSDEWNKAISDPHYGAPKKQKQRIEDAWTHGT